MASDRIWRDPKEKIVILDSNAVMMLFEFSIDFYAELTRLIGKYHLVIPTPVIEELKLLSQKGDGKTARKARACLQLVKNIEIKAVEDTQVDDAVFALAQQLNGIVVTNDKNLRRKFKEHHLSVIFLRGKHILSLE